MRVIIGAALLLSAPFLVQAATNQCFYPNGKLATDYTWVSCNTTSTTFSSCCVPSEGDICMENGLCDWPGHGVYRGTCTDKAWKDGSCANFCPGLTMNTYLPLNRCTTSQYCCPTDPSTNCCTDGSELFRIDGPPPGASTSSAAPTATSSPTGTGASNSSPATTTGTAAAASSSASTGPNTIVIGAAAGAAGLAIVLLVAGIACFFMRRKKRRAAKGDRPTTGNAGLTQNEGYPSHSPQSPAMEMTKVQQVYSPPPDYQSPVQAQGQGWPFPAGEPEKAYYSGQVGGQGQEKMYYSGQVGGQQGQESSAYGSGYYQPPQRNAVETDSRPITKPVFEMAG